MVGPAPSLGAARKVAALRLGLALVPGLLLLAIPGTEHLYLWVFGIWHPLLGHVAAGLMVHSMLRDRPEGAPSGRPEQLLLVATILACIAFVILLFVGGINWMA